MAHLDAVPVVRAVGVDGFVDGCEIGVQVEHCQGLSEIETVATGDDRGQRLQRCREPVAAIVEVVVDDLGEATREIVQVIESVPVAGESSLGCHCLKPGEIAGSRQQRAHQVPGGDFPALGSAGLLDALERSCDLAFAAAGEFIGELLYLVYLALGCGTVRSGQKQVDTPVALAGA
ncbi:hypothetical protein [Nocardia sp. NPDC057227]|uniref:hypothetical protein n=1 Tax=Nocardia sp. NPDC057227 TaxID=3346056 RepID=UPI00362FBF2D